MAPARTAALLLVQVQLAAADASKDWCIQGPAPAQPNSRHAEPETSPCARKEAALVRMPDVLARINKAASRKGIAASNLFEQCKDQAAKYFKACEDDDDTTSRRGIAAERHPLFAICKLMDDKKRSCTSLSKTQKEQWLPNVGKKMCWNKDKTICKCAAHKEWKECMEEFLVAEEFDGWYDDELQEVASSTNVFGTNCKAACLLGWCKSGCLTCTAPAQSRDAAIAGRDAMPSSACSREEEVLAGMPKVLARLNEAASRNGISASNYGAPAVFNGHEATTAASNYGAATAALVSVPLLVGFVAGVLVNSVYNRKKAGGVHEPRSAAPDEEEARMTAADAEPALQQISL